MKAAAPLQWHFVLRGCRPPSSAAVIQSKRKLFNYNADGTASKGCCVKADMLMETEMVKVQIQKTEKVASAMGGGVADE